MSYAVKEIFLTLQGEGAQAGRVAVFCRFAGCNLWSGLERDRASAICRFCDTDFVGTDGAAGGKYPDAESLAEAVAAHWPGASADVARPLVVCTGGEPLLQLDRPLIEALHAHDFEIAVETNGSLPAPEGIDWLCVSPKAGAEFVQRQGDELKVVYPQPFDWEELASLPFRHRFIQPMDGPDRRAYTEAAIAFCLAHPQWRLSLQVHKMIGIP